MTITEHNKKELDKLLKHNNIWLHQNETQKTNKILAILTFFIALGEISSLPKNLFGEKINTFWLLITILIILTLTVIIIHQTKKTLHIQHIKKECKNIIEVNYGKKSKY